MIVYHIEFQNIVEKFRGKPIAYIFNKSLKIGKFPDCLKYSVINPLFKKGKSLN